MKKYMSWQDLINQTIEKRARDIAWLSLTDEQREDFRTKARKAREERMAKNQ